MKVLVEWRGQSPHVTLKARTQAEAVTLDLLDQAPRITFTFETNGQLRSMERRITNARVRGFKQRKVAQP
jgi:hypothetical protein